MVKISAGWSAKEILASDVVVDLNVLCAFMEDIIMSNVDSTTIVIIKRSGSGLWSIHVSHELTDHTHGM